MLPRRRPPSDRFVDRTGMDGYGYGCSGGVGSSNGAGGDGGDDHVGFGGDPFGYGGTPWPQNAEQRSVLDGHADAVQTLTQWNDLLGQLTLQLNGIRTSQAARHHELLRFRNGAGGVNSGESSFSPVFDDRRRYMSIPLPPSPAYSNSLYSPSPGFQSGDHQRCAYNIQQNRTGMSSNLNSSVDVDWFFGMNNESFWPNGHNRTAIPPSQPIVCPHLRNLQGSIATFALGPSGAMSLQMKIRQGLDEEEIQILFREILQNLPDLMFHEYANYVVQELLEVCSAQQLSSIVTYLTRGRKPMALTACFDPYGHRVIQRLLANASTPILRRDLLSIIAPVGANLVKHLNGHNVVLYCLRNLSNEDNEVLYTELWINCFDISTDKNGCRAIQKCIASSSGVQRELLLQAILDFAFILCSHRYGNYVVQHVLSLQVPGFCAALIRKLKGQFFKLSRDKYASNVVESCFRASGEEEFESILQELLQELPKDPDHMPVFLHQYGNYVFKQAVEVAKRKGYVSSYHRLQAVIRTNAKLMKDDYHGKKAVKELKKGRMLLPETDAALRGL